MLNNIFDSHAHYDNERFDSDRDEVISEILQNGVVNVINIGCDMETSKSSVALAKKYPCFFASVGVHPHEAENVYDGYLHDLEEMTKEEHVVAIGEIGLDYHYDFSPREIQKRVFEEQLILANRLSLPVIIHAREATEDYLTLLKKYRPQGVVHCFSGSTQTAKSIIELGMYIGFTGIVTFKNARRALEAVEAVPTDRLLLETDCPYMAPEPYRGKRCQSDMIKKTGEIIADIKKMPVQELINTANENTKRLFKIT